MKKLVLILAVVTAMAAISGCNKQAEDSNILVGTKWVTTCSNDEIIVLEFSSSSEVTGYIASIEGIISGNPYKGSYSLSGSSIAFNGLQIKRIYHLYELRSGTISGSILSTSGREKYGENGQWFGWNTNWNKK